MKDKCNYYNTKNLNNTLQQNNLEPIYRLAALFARRAKAVIFACGTKRVKEWSKILLWKLCVEGHGYKQSPYSMTGFYLPHLLRKTILATFSNG
jgi:hypothetical protein